MFKIQDTIFDIKYAGLTAYVDENNDNLVFGLFIMSKAKGNLFSGEPVHFEADILLKIKPNEIKEWKNIAEKKVEWKEYPENDNEEPAAFFAAYDLEEVYEAKIEFKEKDNKLTVKINAKTGIGSPCPFLDEEIQDDIFYSLNKEDVPLEIETQVDFFAIKFAKDTTEEECKNKIKPYLDVAKLIYVQSDYGISYMIPNDSNVETNMLISGYWAMHGWSEQYDYNYIRRRAYNYTAGPFTEQELAIIIQKHPEEKAAIMDVLFSPSDKIVFDLLHFPLKGEDKYDLFKKILEENMICIQLELEETWEYNRRISLGLEPKPSFLDNYSDYDYD